MTGWLTDEERQLARERIAAWPAAERKQLVTLPAREVEAIGLLVALLDVRPLDTIAPKSAAACGTMGA